MLELLDTRSSFLFAVLVLTWVAMGLLLLIVFHLHTRLQRLEQADGAANPQASPYSRLVGRSLRSVAHASDFPPGARLLLLLSSTCRSCARLLNELPAVLDQDAACLVAWVDGAAPPVTALPRGVFVLPDGPHIAAALEIGVTPFALLLDADGNVIRGLPVENASTVRSLFGHPPGESTPAWSGVAVSNYQLKEVAP